VITAVVCGIATVALLLASALDDHRKNTASKEQPK
jgi:multisubunit Na+/H+ antiporter MnhC subunit